MIESGRERTACHTAYCISVYIDLTTYSPRTIQACSCSGKHTYKLYTEWVLYVALTRAIQ